jgi:Zn-dependent protease with chaperone function
MAIILYILALLIELISAGIRYWFGMLIGGPALALLFALAPLGWSVLVLMGLPSGSMLTRQELGARPASQRERDVVDPILSDLVQRRAGTMAPYRWFVIDSPEVNAYVVGKTLYVLRGLIQSPHLQAILAHELGHLTSMDGRMSSAMRRMSVPGAMVVARWFAGDPESPEGPGCIFGGLSLFLAVLAGGFSSVVLAIPLGNYWRLREYEADRYAALLGEAGPLAEALEHFQILDQPTPWMFVKSSVARSHPYTELRIDKLLAYERDPELATISAATSGDQARIVSSSVLFGAIGLVVMLMCVGLEASVGLLKRPPQTSASVSSSLPFGAPTITAGLRPVVTKEPVGVESTERPRPTDPPTPPDRPTATQPTSTNQPTPTVKACDKADLKHVYSVVLYDAPGELSGEIGTARGALQVLCDEAVKQDRYTWRKVRYNALEGWINDRYLDVQIHPTATVQACGSAVALSYISLWSDPTTKGEKWAGLSRNTSIELVCDQAPVQAEGETWRRARAAVDGQGSIEGWVKISDLDSIVESGSTTPATNATATPGPSPTAAAAADTCRTVRLAATLDGQPLTSLQLRAAPSLKGDPIGTMKGGDTAQLTTEIQIADGRIWGRVRVGGILGWASVRAFEPAC